MPQIVFLEQYHLNVCANLDVYYLRVPRSYLTKVVRKGERHNVEFLEGEYDPNEDRRLDVQFEDGTVAVGLPNYVFDVVE
jgi:hypothetical protein